MQVFKEMRTRVRDALLSEVFIYLFISYSYLLFVTCNFFEEFFLYRLKRNEMGRK